MQVTKKSIALMEIAYTVTDSGGYVFMDRFTYPTTSPLTAKQIDNRINTDYIKWRTVMATPVVKPTKADRERELARAKRDKSEIEQHIVVLTTSIAESV